MLQAPADAKPAAAKTDGNGDGGSGGLALPEISIDGATGQELADRAGHRAHLRRAAASPTR